MSDIVDDERDEGLLLAWSAVAMGAGRPSDGNRLAIMSAARARAHGIANKGRKRGRWPLLALGAIVLAA